MHAQAVKESFHHQRPPRRFPYRTMEIKDHLRLGKVWREQIPRLATIETAASIRHQLSLVIVDRKHDPMPEESATGKVADSKPSCRGGVHRALLQIRMPAQAEREQQSMGSIRASAPWASF